MRNLYVVAIGGSGERVMRSLIMLLTSGVNVNAQRVVPIFIENDIKSHALESCIKLLKYYSNSSADNKYKGLGLHTTYSKIGGDQADWPSFCRTVIDVPVILNQAGDTIGNLSEVIGGYDSSQPVFDRIDEELRLLFTDDDLDMKLTVGFVGNPNIGSVVLNSLSLSSNTFEDLKTRFSPDDGLIVVGSLFGGTGAAGIPLVVNSINEMDDTRRPVLGTVAMLPYFVTNPKNDRTGNIIDTTKYNVHSDAFDAKTRAALMYYADYMTSMDCMYYVGDGKAKDVYAHCIGGSGQDNRAHLVEVMAALSIIDFSNQLRNTSTTYKRPVWGINDDGDINKLPTNITGVKNKDLARALVKFRMMRQIFTDKAFLKTSIEQMHPYSHNIGFTEPMRTHVVEANKAESSVSSWGLNNLIREWDKWMKELGDEDANRKFRIYDNNFEATDKDITSKFYSETGFGVAKTKMKGTGPFGLGPKVEVAIDAEIQEALASAYRKIYPNGKAEQAAQIPDENRLPLLLQIISKALDDVIANRCDDSLKN